MVLLAALGAGICLCIGGGASTRAPEDIGSMTRERAVLYVLWAAGAGALYMVAALRPAVHGRQAVWVVLGFAAAMRAITFAPPPLLSTDAYRYVWDGRVQAAGINPYLHIPAAPELQALRDRGTGPAAIYPNINRADFAPTIYPPAAQAIFAAVGLVWPSLWGMKAAMLAFDLMALGAALGLLRAARVPAERVLVYAWNPLVAWEFAGGVHIDAAATGLTGLALLVAVRRWPVLASTALALAVLCKLLPAALFPAFWRRWDWRTPATAAAVIAAGYACYAGAGWRVLGYLPGYAKEEEIAGGGAFLLRLLALLGPAPSWASLAYLGAGALLLGGLAARVMRQLPLPADPGARATVLCRDVMWLGTATAAVLSPHYPWYLAPLALPAVLAPAPAVLWLMVASPVLYLDHGFDEVIWPALVFLPSAALLAWDWLRHARPPRKEALDVRNA